jgi:hypothetical protein
MKERAAFMCIVNFPYEQTAAPYADCRSIEALSCTSPATGNHWLLGNPQSLWSALCRHARSLPHSSISECSLGACNDSNH